MAQRQQQPAATREQTNFNFDRKKSAALLCSNCVCSLHVLSLKLPDFNLPRHHFDHRESIYLVFIKKVPRLLGLLKLLVKNCNKQLQLPPTENNLHPLSYMT